MGEVATSRSTRRPEYEASGYCASRGHVVSRRATGTRSGRAGYHTRTLPDPRGFVPCAASNARLTVGRSIVGRPTEASSTALTALNRRKTSFARAGNRPRCRPLVAVAPCHWPPSTANAKVIVPGNHGGRRRLRSDDDALRLERVGRGWRWQRTSRSTSTSPCCAGRMARRGRFSPGATASVSSTSTATKVEVEVTDFKEQPDGSIRPGAASGFLKRKLRVDGADRQVAPPEDDVRVLQVAF